MTDLYKLLELAETSLSDYYAGAQYSKYDKEILEAVRKALAEKPAKVTPAGWTLVPVEPTPAMVSAYLAGNAAYWKAVDDGPKHPAKWRNGTPAEATAEGYRAMLAAAPAAPAPVAQGDCQPRRELWTPAEFAAALAASAPIGVNPSGI